MSASGGSNNNVLVMAIFLAICVISFVHVFLFPVYELRPRSGPARTMAQLEQSLCSARGSAAAIAALVASGPAATRPADIAARPCPRDGIVTVAQGGRLGNQLWEYASVWAVARRTGLEPFVPQCVRRRLDKVFARLSVPPLLTVAHCPTGEFVRSLDAWNLTEQSILLPRYSIMPEVVLTWPQDIRREFTFHETITSQAQRVLKRAATATTRRGPPQAHLVFVAVHVRRTDYSSYLWRTRNVAPARPDYYRRAMRYFEDKYGRVVFVVVSDDPSWCLRHIADRPNVYVVSRSASVSGAGAAAQDLAVMAACNHSIIDYGTFGVWGAILAAGETVLYNVSQHSSVRVSELLPDWHVFS